MSMTKSEFLRRCQGLRWGLRGYGAAVDYQVAVLAEEAGVEWAPEPTPEPTGDLSMVRVIDAWGTTWRSDPTGDWYRISTASIHPWSKVPQPATVLRPEGAEEPSDG